MAVTRLKRKGRRNKVIAKGKVARIQLLTATPVIKQVNVEEIKEGFKSKPAKATEKKETPKAEAPEAVVVEAPKKKAAPKKEAAAEKTEKPAAKKPAAKKAAPKKEDKEEK